MLCHLCNINTCTYKKGTHVSLHVFKIRNWKYTYLHPHWLKVNIELKLPNIYHISYQVIYACESFVFFHFLQTCKNISVLKFSYNKGLPISYVCISLCSVISKNLIGVLIYSCNFNLSNIASCWLYRWPMFTMLCKC